LPATELQQLARGGSSVLALQVSAAMRCFTPAFFDSGSRVDGSVAVGCDVNDAKIDTKHVRSLERLGLIDFADCRQVEDAANEKEIGFSFAAGKQFALTFPADEWDDLATFNRPDRDAVVRFEAEDTIIICKGSQWTKGPLRLVINLVGVGDLCDAANDDLRCEARAGSDAVVDELMQGVLTENVLVPCGRTDLVAGGIGLFESALQNDVLIFRRIKFEVNNEPHGFMLNTRQASCQE